MRSNRKAAILYMMHVDWRWIKQRPHFLAESLAVEHEVTVFYALDSRRGALARNNSEIRRFPLIVPSSKRNVLWRLWKPIAHCQKACLTFIAMLCQPKMIWLTSPLLYPYLPALSNKVPIIYDCMDDLLGFGEIAYSQAVLLDWERQLVSKASLVLCSSEYLCNMLDRRYGARDKIELIRNGLPGRLIREATGPSPAKHSPSHPMTRNGFLDVAYFGTISEWIDLDLLLYCLQELPFVRFHMIGPKTVELPAANPRLIYRGVMEHDRLQHIARQYHAFILPFRLSELIEAVDPVKLYEYLSLGRDVISVRYPEIDRFSPFVRFYNTADELKAVLTSLAFTNAQEVYGLAGRAAFLANHSWERHAVEIEKLLEKL